MGPTNTFTFDKYARCYSLLYQFNSVFTKPHPEEIVTNPSSFSMKPSMTNTTDLYSTDIVLSGKKYYWCYTRALPHFRGRARWHTIIIIGELCHRDGTILANNVYPFTFLWCSTRLF